MRKYLISAALLLIAAGLNAGQLKLQDINIRDPFILVDNGVYYMYASSTVDGIGGVGVYTSRDRNDWEPLRQVLPVRDCQQPCGMEAEQGPKRLIKITRLFFNGD